jgi:hypothetical protein
MKMERGTFRVCRLEVRTTVRNFWRRTHRSCGTTRHDGRLFIELAGMDLVEGGGDDLLVRIGTQVLAYSQMQLSKRMQGMPAKFFRKRE